MTAEMDAEGDMDLPYFETDPQQDVLVSLREVSLQVRRVRDGEHQAWKWAVIAMACAFTSSCVCILSGTAGVGAWEYKEEINKFFEAFPADGGPLGPLPQDPFVGGWIILLDRLQGNKRHEHAGGVYKLDQDENECLKSLMQQRNGFVHFGPEGKIVFHSYFPPILLSVLGVLDRITTDDWGFHYFDDAEREEMATLRGAIRADLEALAG
ncbi:hypothetical protein [Pseudooceanicola aestuarii]|uniref:hypothetical protein n=1 Tax=Pseudooceanicola aestuarii TaxID=2697319 RepID=UPI0013D0B1A8|nr:hypothetical protein [Pseudooceanicola aestuarii]